MWSVSVCPRVILPLLAFTATAVFSAGCPGDPPTDAECGIDDATEVRGVETTTTAALEVDHKDSWRATSIFRARRYVDRARGTVSGAGTVEVVAPPGASPGGLRALGPTDGTENGLALAFEAAKGAPGSELAITQQAFLSHFSLAVPLPTDPTPGDRMIWTPENAPVALEGSYNVSLAGAASEDFATEAVSGESPYTTPEGLKSENPIAVAHWSGNPRNRVNLIVMPDGYTEAELPRFRKQVDEMVEYLKNSADNDFFGEYADLFNIIRVDVPSVESGASCDDGTSNLRDTRYGVTFPVGCINAVLGTNLNDRFPFARRYTQAVRDSLRIYHDGVSIADEMMILSNTQKYGGSGIPGLLTMTRSASWATAAHELGHSWGRLSDEFVNPGDICNILGGGTPNLSRRKDRLEDVKWAHWIAEGTPIPTPSDYDSGDPGSIIGLYQGGGGGCDSSLYRPSTSCKMGGNGQPFCSVCKEQMIRRTYDRASLIEGPITRSGALLSAEVLPSRAASMRARWFVDGELYQDSDGYEPFDVGIVSAGDHEVKLVVWDDAAPVRKNRCDLAFSATYDLTL